MDQLPWSRMALSKKIMKTQTVSISQLAKRSKSREQKTTLDLVNLLQQQARPQLVDTEPILMESMIMKMDKVVHSLTQAKMRGSRRRLSKPRPSSKS